MAKTCLKCGYERKEIELVSDLECPHCGAIYAKVEAKVAREKNAKLEKIEEPHKPVLEETEIEIETKKYDYSGYSIVSWALGALFLLVGLGSSEDSFLKSFSCLVTASLLLPPARDFVYQKTNLKLTTGIRTVLILTVLGTSMSLYRRLPNENIPISLEQQQVASVKASQKAERKKHTAELIHQRAERALRNAERLRQEEEIEKLKNPEQVRKEQIQSQLSPWDGSHVKVERYIKENMKNPDSYQHVKTGVIDKGDFLLVLTRYRGTNSFNALVLETALFKVSPETGDILEASKF